MWETSVVATVMVVLLAVNALGVVLVAFQLPGTWVILIATAVVSWWQHWWQAQPWGEAVITWWTLLGLLGLATLGEVLEFLAGAAGASHAGASRRGVIGAFAIGIVGALVGSIFIPIPIVGTLVGAAIGAGVGSIGGDVWAGREFRPAMTAGRGAAVGRLWGAVLKLAVAGVMWFVAAIAMAWP